jgi:nucleoside-diphosphate-sugar epimerase
MRVFITGASGFVGSAVVRELLQAGHQVLGMTRSQAGADALTAAGAQVHWGELTDLASLTAGASSADAVIHTAFIHDFSNFAESCRIDGRAIETLGAALEGSTRPLLVTSGVAMLVSGRAATEEDRVSDVDLSRFPRVSEATADKLVERGINASVVRLPPSVHGEGDHGFVPMLIALAREKGIAAYVGEGDHLWAAVHRPAAAVAYRLALENATPGTRYHAIAEEGVPFREISAVIGRRLHLPVTSLTPEEAASHFGWFTTFVSRNLSATSHRTRQSLGWQPTGPTLLADIDTPSYFPA